jgi:hypothetical protein
MTLTEQEKKQLTEFLGECLHRWKWIPGGGLVCINCPIDLYRKDDVRYEQVMPVPQNRTFATQADMMALYSQLFKVEKWEEFFLFAWELWVKAHCRDYRLFTAWLFCLSGSDYEARCKMISEFLKGGK